jgi:hypothetical protein
MSPKKKKHPQLSKQRTKIAYIVKAITILEALASYNGCPEWSVHI